MAKELKSNDKNIIQINEHGKSKSQIIKRNPRLLQRFRQSFLLKYFTYTPVLSTITLGAKKIKCPFKVRQNLS